MTNLAGDIDPAAPGMLGETAKRLRNIEQALTSGGEPSHSSLMALAGQITALTEQMRNEQQLIRQLAENQQGLKPVLEDLARRLDTRN